MNKVITLILTIFIVVQVSFGQQADVQFGKNRIQYHEFKWRYYSAENFDIYFYDNGHLMAKQAAQYLEEEFDKITDLIGYPPYAKTKIFLYNSVKDMQQSNVGIDDNQFDVSGETKFIKPYVEVANPGTVQGLKQELILKVSQFLVDEMLFGGSLKDMFQSTYLLNLPSWFVLGISEYIAKGWNEEMDDYIREMMTNINSQKLTRYNQKDAKIIGHSIWNFISERYGRSNISNILNYTRIIRNEEKSITATLGVSFKTLMLEWEEYYTSMNDQLVTSYIHPNKESRINNNRRKFDLHQVKINPTGTHMAYTRGKEGIHQVVIVDLTNGKEDIVLKSGTSVINQQVDPEIMVVDWADESTLGIINNERGNLLFWLYDVPTKNKFSRPINKLTNVKSMDFNNNGRLAIISGEVNGKNDLYLLSTRRDRIKRLTNDEYDDITPSFVPNSNVIVFSSNRQSDTLDTKQKVNYSSISNNYNLYFYNLDTTKNVLRRVTNTISKDYYPIATSLNDIYYLSDQKGIINVYHYNLEEEIYTQVTNYQLSIRDYDFNVATQSMSYIMLDNQNEKLYFDQDFNFEANVFTPASGRKQIMLAKQLALKRATKQSSESNKFESVVEEKQEIPKSELEKLFEADVEQQQKSVDTLTGIINTDDYIFEEDVTEEEKNTGSFLSQYRNFRKKTEIQGPFSYESRFSTNNIVTSFIFNPLWGFGINLDTRMNDMLENHKFGGGANFTADIRSGNIYAEYFYLKQFIDFEARYNRKVIYFDEMPHKYSKNEFEVGASYPFSVKSRISIKPFFATTRFDNSVPQLAPLKFEESKKNNYGGGSLEFVFDNSVVNELNSIVGTRLKTSFKHYEGLTSSNKSFSKVSFDFRHYQKIHREIVFATKLYYGSFLGKGAHNFMVGGVDNWVTIGNNHNVEGNSPLAISESADNSTLLFSEFVTNLRGFRYSELYGEHSIVANFELRFPVVRYLHSRQIASNFFRNLQFIGFYDIGSAWTGNSPFDEENNIGNEIIKEGAFEAEIKTFRNPWLSSYGVGVRTVILGYYLKLDVAWPMIDYKVQDARFTVSLGLDF